ncbi:hypothetical protein, partial [Nostoc sp. ChiSLP03a]|uniref:hypothetical protein n=1 Tax=Nostoc sp. ChiSLP03a TaxID=3075380 RepID=UPI002AD35BF2
FCGIFNSFFQFFSALFNLNLQFETHYTFTKYTLVNNLAQLHTEMVLGQDNCFHAQTAQRGAVRLRYTVSTY